MSDEEIKESPNEEGIETGDESTEVQQETFSEAFLKIAKGESSEEENAEEKPEENADVKPEDKKGDESAEKKEEPEGDDEKKEKDTKAEGDEKKEPEEEEDPAKKRGQEIIDEEAEAERVAKEKQDKADREEQLVKDRAEAGKVSPLSNADVDYFMGLLPEDRLPDKITLKVDGEDVEIPIKEYVKQNPEVMLLSTLQAQELLVSLVNRGLLATGKGVEAAISKANEDRDADIFGLSVTVHLQNAGHMGVDLDATINSKGIGEWYKGQSKETKALFNATAKDYALGIGQYLNEAGLVKGREKAAKIDEKAKEKKDKHVDLHKSTMDSTGAAPGEFTSEEDEKKEYSSAFSELARKKESEKKQV